MQGVEKDSRTDGLMIVSIDDEPKGKIEKT